jgi:hypothetical protein
MKISANVIGSRVIEIPKLDRNNKATKSINNIQKIR